MSEKEIIEIIEQYKNNPDIIDDENNYEYIKKLVNAIFLIFNHDVNTWSKTLDDYFKNNKEILLKISNSEIFIMIFTIQYGDKLPELSNEVLDSYKDLILNILKNNGSLNWRKSKLLFNYLVEHNQTLLSNLNIEELFPEITEEVLNQYGDVILSYIQKKKFISSNWESNKLLFNYMAKHNRTLLNMLDLKKIFPEITEEVLNQYGDIILSYFRENASFNYNNYYLNRIKKHSIPETWYISRALFNYMAEHDHTLLTKLDLEKIFPEITEEVLNQYGDAILSYIQRKKFISSNWKSNELLFNYMAKHNRTLLTKLDLEKIFPEITEEVLNQYGDVILSYIQKKKFIFSNWESNKLLFNYMAKHNRTLLNMLDLEKIFPEITEEVLNQYGDAILSYIQRKKFISSNWKSNELLFNYLKEHNRTLLSLLDLEKTFPEITEEVLNQYGDVILSYIQRKKFISSNWKSNKLLFNYLKEHNLTLLSLLDLKKIFPEITDEIINEYEDIILEDIEYILKNNKSLIKNIPLEFLIKSDKCLEFISKEYDIPKDILKYKLNYLYNKNDELLETLDFRILKIDSISMQDLIMFTLYPDIEEKIANLDNKILMYFTKILKVVDNKEYDRTAIIEAILNNINNYEELLNVLPLEELDEEKIKNLILLLKRENNLFEINNLKDLTDINFRNKKNSYFKSIENNFDNMDKLIIKNAIFEKKYDLDYEKAKFIRDRYFHNIEELKKSSLDNGIINIIQEFDNIIKEDSIENLKILYLTSKTIENDFNTALSLESYLRSAYAKLYNETLYQLNDNDISKNKIFQNVFYNGKKIKFYEANGDFNMQVHVLGAYRYWTRPDNFLNDWEQPKIASHGICTSYIGNNQIAIARPNGPIIGFSNFEKGSLLLAGNYDLASTNKDFSISSEKPYNFLPPKTMIDSTRHTHNEMVIDRIKHDGDINNIRKRNPNYIVYIVDDINNQNNFLDKNEFYQMTLQASSDFNIPIVVIDRLKYAKSEKLKCLMLEKKFYETNDSQVLEDLFLTYMNNRVGCRKFDKEDNAIYCEEFNDSVIKKFCQRILNKLKSECDSIVIDNSSVNNLGNIAKMINLLTNEKNNSDSFDLEEELENAKNLYENYKQKVKNAAQVETFDDIKRI